MKNTSLRTHAGFASLTACMALSMFSTACSSEGDLGAIHEPSICGTTTDWQDVESYDGSLGPTVAFVAAHQGPVGYLGPVGCTGTLIGANLLLTAGHCIPSNTTVSFNFQLAPNGTARATDSYNISAVLEDELGGVDYAIVRLDGNAGAVWGTTVPSWFPFADGDAITIIQHPSGLPKKIEGGTLDNLSGGLIGYEDLDTFGGTSGSGVLHDRTGYLVGVHTNGVSDGTCGAGDPNTAQSVPKIYAQSPIMRQRALDAAKVTVLL